MSALPASRTAAETFAGLRSLAGCGGCAAKVNPEIVALLTSVAASSANGGTTLLAGLDPYDDAAVYPLDAERALVSSIDFFPPLVDDPAAYGAIAAANAVSDIYAMGGKVAFALVVSGFPESVPPEVVAEVLGGATEVISSCGGQVVGGHSIHCAEPVFGLSVTGFVHPEKIWKKSGARAGDIVVLSKAIGSGVLISEGTSDGTAAALVAMRETNEHAAQCLADLCDGPNAVTDVTGYGLLGHASEIAQRSAAALYIEADAVPLLPGALETARRGVRTSADASTRGALKGLVGVSTDVPSELTALLFDPQTSGGLLATVRPGDAEPLCRQGWHCIGRVEPGTAGIIVE